MKRSLLIMTLVAFSVTATTAQDAARTPTEICEASVPADEPETRTYAQPEDALEPGVDYRAIFCTEVGPIYVDLLEEYTPLTVNSFVFLAQNGYFNNTTFHRVIQDFMAQGGDPTATGTGGPGYQFADEFVGFLNFDRPGWLAMANAGPGTNGSQFFITTVPYPSLDFKHTIFGEVLEGQDNVASIRLRNPETDTEPGTILQTVVIIADPGSVATTYEALGAATQEDVQAGMDHIKELLDERVTLDEDATGMMSAEEVVANAPEAIQEQYADFLTRRHFQYRTTARLLNVQCDLENIGFTSMSYTLDAFESREDATAALTDEFFTQLPLHTGFVETKNAENLSYPVYTVEITECDSPTLRALTSWQRGRFVITAEVAIPAASEAAPVVHRVLVDFVGLRIFEPLLADVLRREIR